MGKYPCGKCEKNAKSSAILCSICKKWFHFKCVNLTISDVKTIEKEQFLGDWKCLNCYSISDKNESMTNASRESTEENSEELNYSSLADEINKSVLQENEDLRKELHLEKHKSSFYILELEDKIKQIEEDYKLLKKVSDEKEQELMTKMKALENKLRYEKEAKENLISEVEEQNKTSEHVQNYINRSCDKCVVLKEEITKMLDTIRSLESIIGILERETQNKQDTTNKRTGDPNCMHCFPPLNGAQQPTCDVEKWLKVPSRQSAKPVSSHNSGPKFFSNNLFNVLSDVSAEEVSEENECTISSINTANINTAKSKVHQTKPSGLKTNHVHYRNTCVNKTKDTLLICADSHGRGLSWHINKNKNQNTHSAVGFVRPGGRTKDILDSRNIFNELKNKGDVLVIFCGTNDISKNEANEAITGIAETIKNVRNNNIILVDLPNRFDLPQWSCVNVLQRKSNLSIKELCDSYSNVRLVEVSKAERHLHSRHGLHLNNRGKRWLAEQICAAVNYMNDGTTSPSQPQGDLLSDEGVPAAAETTSPLTCPSTPADERAAASSPPTTPVSTEGVPAATGFESPTFLHITTPATDSATPAGNGLLPSVQHPL